MLGKFGAGLAAAALASLALGSLVAPAPLAAQYGLPLSDDTSVAYLRAVGMRDLALAGLIVDGLRRDDRGKLSAVLSACAFVGACDFALVARGRGRRAGANLAIHGLGTTGLLAIVALIRRER